MRLDDGGSSLWLFDSGIGSGDLRVGALNGSHAAADLGILGIGSGGVLAGSVISDTGADLQVRMTDGTQVDIDVTGVRNVQDVLDLFSEADPRLLATVNANGTGIDLRDTAGGAGNLGVLAKNGSFAAQDLGLLGTGT